MAEKDTSKDSKDSLNENKNELTSHFQAKVFPGERTYLKKEEKIKIIPQKPKTLNKYLKCL
jgi:hypothetical protein